MLYFDEGIDYEFKYYSQIAIWSHMDVIYFQINSPDSAVLQFTFLD